MMVAVDFVGGTKKLKLNLTGTSVGKNGGVLNI